MVTEDSSREVWLRQARSYLRNADPVLARLIDDRPDFDLAEARLDNPFGLVLPQPGDQLPVLGHLRAGQDTTAASARLSAYPPS